MRANVFSLILGIVLIMIVSAAYRSNPTPIRQISQLAFLASLALSISLFSYLAGAKISTLAAFQDRDF